jgi:hypothetical protein
MIIDYAEIDRDGRLGTSPIIFGFPVPNFFEQVIFPRFLDPSFRLNGPNLSYLRSFWLFHTLVPAHANWNLSSF